MLKDVNFEQLEDAINKAGKQGFRVSWMKPIDLGKL